MATLATQRVTGLGLVLFYRPNDQRIRESRWGGAPAPANGVCVSAPCPKGEGEGSWAWAGNETRSQTDSENLSRMTMAAEESDGEAVVLIVRTLPNRLVDDFEFIAVSSDPLGDAFTELISVTVHRGAEDFDLIKHKPLPCAFLRQ